LLLKNQDPGLEAFVVWVPELGAHEGDVAEASRLVPDPRASHYWDPGEVVGSAYGRLLPTPTAAWDVYMLFGRSASWPMSGVPKPDFWMQQLDGVTDAPRLDGDVFASVAARLLRQGRWQRPGP
jgi:hypothetical protein